MNALIAKLGGSALVAVAIFFGGMFTQKKLTRDCPDCSCPEVVIPPCPKPELQSIDFEKVKNFKGSIVLHQHYHVEVNGDSLVNKAWEDLLAKKLGELKLSRCK